MIKFLKGILFMICLTFFSTFTFTNSINKISYANGELSIYFSENIPKYTVTSEPSLQLLSFNFSNMSILNTVNNKDIKDSFISNYIIDKNSSNKISLNIFTEKNIKYVVSEISNKLIISFKKEEVKLDEKKYTIVIDAGHGGKDPGASYSGYNEKDIALSVAINLYENLKKDYNVILTRDSDYFIPLDERAKIGRDNNADLFVSIHLNASKNRSARGVEAFYFSKNPSRYASEIAKFENSFDITGAKKLASSEFLVQDILYKLNQTQSASLADTVVDNISYGMNIPKRKIDGANFAVLRGSTAPSILIELGFLTNSSDVKIYSTESARKKVANLIADSIRKHY